MQTWQNSGKDNDGFACFKNTHLFGMYTCCLFFLFIGEKKTHCNRSKFQFLLSSQNKTQPRTNTQKTKIQNEKSQTTIFYLFPQIQPKQKRGRDKDRSSPASHLSDCCGGAKWKRKQEKKYLQTRSKGALRAQILAGEEKLHILVVECRSEKENLFNTGVCCLGLGSPCLLPPHPSRWK